MRTFGFGGAYEYDYIAKEYTFNFYDEIRGLARVAENNLRDALNVPRVGEGWISESALYHALTKAFPETLVIHHGRPSWLGRQHFDIWFPRWKIAVERHGRQHFEPVEFFGGRGTFQETIARDERKAALAQEHNVSLIIATRDMSHDEVIRQVSLCREKRLGNTGN